MHGAVEVAYDQRNDSIQLGNSHVIFPASRLDVNGTLGSALNVRLESRDLDDVLPAMTIVGETPVKLPFTLEQNGSALFEGTVDGPIKSARVAGALTLTNFEAQKQRIDKLVANLTAMSTGAQVSSFALGTGETASGGIGGSCSAELEAHGRIEHQSERKAAGS